MKKKILIIDDDQSYLFSLKWTFKDKYDVMLSANPIRAEQLFEKYLPEIVILDVNLDPYKQDYDCSLKLLKKIKKVNQTKVIIATIEENEKIKNKFLNSGADAYLIKPISNELLQKNI